MINNILSRCAFIPMSISSLLIGNDVKDTQIDNDSNTKDKVEAEI